MPKNALLGGLAQLAIITVIKVTIFFFFLKNVMGGTKVTTNLIYKHV